MPRTGSPRKLVFISLTLLMIPIAWYCSKLLELRSNLSTQIIHRAKLSDGSAAGAFLGLSKTIPPDVVRDKSDYVVFYDDAVKIDAVSSLPDWEDRKLLTTYLRYNMGKFSTLPQGWILWAMAEKPHRKTFDQDWISQLNFEPGDRVCGGYVVLRRDPTDIEFGMSLGDERSDDLVEARLIISMRLFKEADPDGAIFMTKTLMWRKKTSKAVMPMERRLPRWLHEVVSWWLIEQGTNHLKQIAKGGA